MSSETAVQQGKISRRTLDMIKRWDGAHKNAIEGFPLFVAAVCMGYSAGVDAATMNVGCCSSLTLPFISPSPLFPPFFPHGEGMFFLGLEIRHAGQEEPRDREYKHDQSI